MEIEFKPHKNYLLVEVASNYSLHEANNLFVEVLDYLAFNKINRVLIDCSLLKGFKDILEEYYYAEYAAKLYREKFESGLLPMIKFAYVFNERFYNDDKDGEILANNRGLWNKTFENLENAMEWLMKK